MSQNPPPKQSLDALIQEFIRLPEATRERGLKIFEERFPEQGKELLAYFSQNKGLVDEAQGYEHWLRKYGPHTFTGSFAPFHHEFWEWYWPIAQQLRAGEPLDPNDLVALLPWSRDTGKSSHSEWSALAEGALVRRGYVLWVSGKQEQAEEHVISIRDRIESEQLGRTYPWLAKPKIGAHGNKFGWGKEFLMTGETRSGFGWAVRPAGLNVALRGGKVLDMRPTLIVLSDVDEIGDSIAVVEGKEQMIARSILPMGDANTRIIFDQNPIHAGSVMNRILTRTSSVLAVRRVIGGGPVPAFKEDLVIEFEQTEHGPRHIIKAGTPTWADMNIVKCQVFLDRSGIDAFKAEYMHDLTANDEERVLPEYDDRVTRANLITWSQFEQMYGQRRIPADWVCESGLDIGYSTGHRSGWTFLTTAPAWCKLAGSRFRYRGRSFQAVGIDDQSIAVKASLWKGEQIEREFMSHEKLGERMVLNSKHGWHFHPCDSAKTAGLAQWRHFLTCDHHQPHPFHRDEKGPDGLWKIGCPSWFDVVADDQFFSPVDDYGLKRHRDGAYNWKRRKVKVTESGLTVDEPMKMDDDECLIAGTMIITQKGDISIENISENDVVLTRQGWCSVERAEMTSKDAEIWTINLSNGSHLSGTRRHPIWVQGYGWKPLSELRVGERLLSSTESGSIVIQTQSIGHIEHTLSHMFTRLNEGSRRYMLNSGNMLPDYHYQMDTQFTTEIITPLIMPLTTWNRSPVQSTASIMEGIGLLSVWPDSEKLWSVCKNLQKSGTEVKKVERGIRSMLRTLSARLKKYLSRVPVVERFMNADHIGTSFAQLDANKHSRTKWSISKDSAWNVGQDFHPLSDLQNDHAVLCVLAVSKEKEKRPVYNLSVKDVPEYFANGVLVHNCDSTRMLLAGQPFGAAQSLSREQKLQALIPAAYQPAAMIERNLSLNQIAMNSELAMMLAKKALGGGGKPVILDEFGNQRA